MFNKRRKISSLIIGLVVGVALAFVSPQKALAFLCNPTFPSQVDVGTDAQISFDLSASNPPVSCLNNPDRQRCYIIRGCNTGMTGTYGCSATIAPFTSFDIPNQRLEGTNLVAGEVRNSGLTFWLEEWIPPSGPFVPDVQQRTCGGTEWKIQMSAARCEAGAFRVVGVRNGAEIDNYDASDQLRLKFDGTKTANFIMGGYSGLVIQNEQVRADLGDFTSPIGGGNRLHFNGTTSADMSIGNLPVGNYQFVVTDSNILGREKYCTFNFRVSVDGNNEVSQNGVANFELCQQIPVTDPGRSLCESCLAKGAIWTGIGCIVAQPTDIVGTIVRVGLGLAGGISLLMMLGAAALYTTSQGNPKRTEQAKELVTSAVIGLLFVIFSVMILQFIGVSILRLPEFGV